MSIRIENVWMRYKRADQDALEDININIQNNEFVCILGPSGCGKTTLLNLIAGLEKPTAGKIFMNQHEIKGPGVDRAVMFQESALFPWLNVRQNVMFGLEGNGVSKKEQHQKALFYLDMVGLIDFQNCYIHEISGGMKQRAALARALALDSGVLLMDEPFASLDSQTKDILRAELLKIWEKTQKTIVFVTHSLEEAVLLADRIIVMTSGPGKVKREFIPHSTRSLERGELIAEIRLALSNEVKNER